MNTKENKKNEEIISIEYYKIETGRVLIRVDETSINFYYRRKIDHKVTLIFEQVMENRCIQTFKVYT